MNFKIVGGFFNIQRQYMTSTNDPYNILLDFKCEWLCFTSIY